MWPRGGQRRGSVRRGRSGGLVVAGSDAAPLFESVEAALDHVAAFVGLGIEDARATAGRATSSPSGFLVLAFWDGDLDASLGQEPAVGRRGVCLVGEHLVGSGAWASGSTVVDADAAHNGGEQRRVGRVTGGEHQTQWPALAVGGEVDLAGHSASGPTDRVVRRLRLAELPVVPSGPLCRA